MLQRVAVVESADCDDRPNGRLMALDTVGDQIEARLPRLLVPAATELSGKNVSESGTEDLEEDKRDKLILNTRTKTKRR